MFLDLMLGINIVDMNICVVLVEIFIWFMVIIMLNLLFFVYFLFI